MATHYNKGDLVVTINNSHYYNIGEVGIVEDVSPGFLKINLFSWRIKNNLAMHNDTNTPWVNNDNVMLIDDMTKEEVFMQ